jgi:hypothetical protein
MAGQPIRRKIVAELEKEAAALTEERGEPITVLDVVYEWVVTGRKVSELAIEMGKRCGLKLSVNDGGGVLSAWVNKQEGGREMLAQARADAAHILAEEALEIVDDVDEEKSAIAKAKLRADQRQWLAAKWNRQAYGETAPQVAVQFDIGQLHIDAMRQRRLETGDHTPSLALPGRDYEVLPAGESADPGGGGS